MLTMAKTRNCHRRQTPAGNGGEVGASFPVQRGGCFWDISPFAVGQRDNEKVRMPFSVSHFLALFPVFLPFSSSQSQKTDDDEIEAIYEALKDEPLVRWKESIKKVMGLPPAEKAGLDM
jgi:hypothetical protein